MNKKLCRSSIDVKLGGVCGGIAEYLNIDSSIVRIIWLFLALVYGSGVALYLICWLILPLDYEVY